VLVVAPAGNWPLTQSHHRLDKQALSQGAMRSAFSHALPAVSARTRAVGRAKRGAPERPPDMTT